MDYLELDPARRGGYDKAGARLLPLPPCSLPHTPIEETFAKDNRGRGPGEDREYQVLGEVLKHMTPEDMIRVAPAREPVSSSWVYRGTKGGVAMMGESAGPRRDRNDGRERRATMAKVFGHIYEQHEWTGGSKSGPGSDPGRTRAYRRLLQRILQQHRVRSVVDLGCGDWASSQFVDWLGIDYLGLDVVSEVVERCRATYARPGIRFEVFDLTTEEPPPADLLICKEVLQHLPNATVHRVLSFLGRYRFALLVNDLRETFYPGWLRRPRTTSPPLNSEVVPGGYRPLELTAEPFRLVARRVLTYPNRYGRRGWLKECLLWENPNP